MTVPSLFSEDFTTRRIESLYRELRRERQLRRETEASIKADVEFWKKQAAKWQALLLAERIKHLPPREKS